MVEYAHQAEIFEYLKTAKVIAVVGLSNKPDRTSYRIAQILKEHGYEVYGINPQIAGQEVEGIPIYQKLQDVPEHIDIVDIFRRSEFLPEVAKDFLETDADVFWAQLGIENQEAGEMLHKAGRNKIVMDRCIKIELMKM